MATESIQNGLDLEVRLERRARWQHIADCFGLPLTGSQIGELDLVSDVEVSRRHFGHLNDAERQEVLWAVGASERTACGC